MPHRDILTTRKVHASHGSGDNVIFVINKPISKANNRSVASIKDFIQAGAESHRNQCRLGDDILVPGIKKHDGVWRIDFLRPFISRTMESHGQQSQKPPLRVAIIGSGLAGLTAAYLLTSGTDDINKHLHIELLERSPTLGMDSESVTVLHQGQERRIDVPMRAFSQGFYPELITLYRHLHIPFAPVSFTFSFGESPASNARQPGPAPSILYSGLHTQRSFGLQLPGRSFLQAVYSVLKIAWSYFALIVAAWYHVRTGHTRDPAHRIRKITFGEWCDNSWVFRSFLTELLLPMLCSIMTANCEAVRSIPAAEMLDYLIATLLYKHFTVQGGVSRVVVALTANLNTDQIHLGVVVKDVVPETNDGKTRIILVCEYKDTGKVMHFHYDHVIFASQASQTAKMLKQLCEHMEQDELQFSLAHCQEQVKQLSKLHYEPSTVVCHNDVSILAPEASAWRGLNFVRPIHTKANDPTFTMATHIICQTPDSVVMQTTNPLPWLFPREDTWISKSEFERFVLTLSGREARRTFFDFEVSKDKDTKLAKLGPLQGVHSKSLWEAKFPGIWFCGSWSYGVPLLEGCVTSARLVVTDILKKADLPTQHIESLWC